MGWYCAFERCCLTHIPYFMFFFSPLFSYILVPNFAEWRYSCRLSHAPFPSSSSLHLPQFTSLSSSCAGLQAQGPVSSFPLILHMDRKNLSWLPPHTLFYLLRMKPSKAIKCSRKLPWWKTRDDGHTGRTLNLWSDAKCIYVSIAMILMRSNLSPRSCENRMSACSH